MYYEKYKKYKYKYLTGGAGVSLEDLDFVADVLNYLTERHKDGTIFLIYKWKKLDSTVTISFNTTNFRFGRTVNSGKSVQKEPGDIGDHLYINEQIMTKYLEQYNIDIELRHFIINILPDGKVQSVTFTLDGVTAFIDRYKEFFGTPRDFVNGLNKEKMLQNIRIFFSKLGSFPQYDEMKFKPEYYIAINGESYVNFVILQRFKDHWVRQIMTEPSSPEPSSPEPSSPEPSELGPSSPEPSDKEKKILHLLFSNVLDIDEIMRQLNENIDLFLKIFGELDSTKCNELRCIMYIKS